MLLCKEGQETPESHVTVGKGTICHADKMLELEGQWGGVEDAQYGFWELNLGLFKNNKCS